MKQKIIVGNWKMNFSLQQGLVFFAIHQDELSDLAKKTTISLVFCPSFEALSSLKSFCTNTEIHLGAQDCSPSNVGPHTGQVAAESLAQLDCSFCIVGHSETRAAYALTDQIIAHKVEQLCNTNITPIICIGETAQMHQSGKTTSVLTQQLNPILELLTKKNLLNNPFCIAYEPIWAIGTGIIPTYESLKETFKTLKKLAEPLTQKRLLYGGSVNEHTVKELSTIPGLDGFLVGNASLDFQKFKKIVSWLDNR